MEEQTGQADQTQFLLADLSTRLRDLDERNRLMRERVLLLGKNLIETKEEVRDEIRELKKTSSSLQEDIEKVKDIISRLVRETDKFVKRDEMILIERMLKDFQPLEFMRKKDVEELLRKS